LKKQWRKDAKSAAYNYYTIDAVFMPNNGPIVTGRAELKKALEFYRNRIQ
jgi:ketosteroid isomerase-like protein